MKKTERWLIIGGLLLLSFHLVAFVPWTGRGYYKHLATPTETGGWTPNGSFGLEGEATAGYWPAWNPPAAAGPGVQAVPRWPWQPILHTHQVEIDLLRLGARCSAGVIGLGLLLAIFNFWNRRREPSMLRYVLYSLAVSQALTWIATPGLYFFIGPYGLDEHLAAIMLSSAAAAVVFGCLLCGWRTLRQREAASAPGSRVIEEDDYRIHRAIAGIGENAGQRARVASDDDEGPGCKVTDAMVSAKRARSGS